MPGAAFCGLRHSESDVYFVKSSAIGPWPLRTIALPLKVRPLTVLQIIAVRANHRLPTIRLTRGIGVHPVDRRTFLATSIASTAGLKTLQARPDEGPQQLDIIDCHTHFYDPSRPEGIPWPEKGSSLYRTVLPEHLQALPKFRPITGTVIVEASSNIEDNAWLLDISKDNPFVVGIVGRLEPESETFAAQVKRFAANPLFRGIRISVQPLQAMLDRNDLTPLKLLADHDLALDVNGGPNTPATIAHAAGLIPSLRFVLNHIGNVAITTAAPPADWREGMNAAAKYPNVFCKISALAEGAARDGRKAPEDLEFYRPYVDVVWNAFGDERVIYGSNWPVSERATDYLTLQRISCLYAFEKGEAATRNFCSLNAARAYHWIDRPGRVKPA